MFCVMVLGLYGAALHYAAGKVQYLGTSVTYSLPIFSHFASKLTPNLVTNTVKSVRVLMALLRFY